MRVKWDASVKALVERLRTVGPEKQPFELGPGRFVVDPIGFHNVMLSDAEMGPDSPRSITGSFQSDLKIYLSRKREPDP